MALTKRDKLDMLEEALDGVQEAMNALRPIEDDNGIYDCLESIQMDLRTMRDEVHVEVYAQEQAEEDQLILDYYKGVL